MKINLKIRTGLWTVLGVVVLIGALSAGFVGFGFRRIQEINQNEREARLVESKVNETLFYFSESRSLARLFLTTSRDIRSFYRAKLLYMPEFEISVEDSKLSFLEAKRLAERRESYSNVFSFLPEQIDIYEESFKDLVNLTEKVVFVRKAAQYKADRIMRDLNALEVSPAHEELLVLLLQIRLKEPDGLTFSEEAEKEFLTLIGNLKEKILTLEMSGYDKNQFISNINNYRMSVLRWFEGKNEETAKIEQFNILLRRIGLSLGKLQYHSQAEANRLLEALPEATSWIPGAVLTVTISMISVVALLIWIVTVKFTRGMVHLREGINRIAHGELNNPVLLDQNDELGELAGFFNSMAEDLELSRDELMEAKDYTDNIISSMFDCLVVIDSNVKIRAVNRSVCHLLGFEEKELLGKDLSFLFSEEEERRTFKRAKFDKLIKEGMITNYEVKLQAKNGNKISVLFSGAVMKDEDGNIIDIVCVAKDITERKIAEEQLSMFKTFAETSNQGMVWTDVDGNIVYINPALVKLLGEGDSEKLFGENIVTSYYPGEEQRRFKEEIFPALIRHEKWAGELVLLRNNEEFVPTYNNFFLIRDNASGDMFFANIITDITDMKKAETDKRDLQEQLYQAQKMEAVGTIASGIAHNFNNILASMRGRTEMAITDVPAESRTYSDLEGVLKGIVSAKQLTTQMMAFSRIHEQDISRIDLIPVIKDAIDMFIASSKGIIKVRENIDADCGFVSADPNQIQHVMLNLLTNSQHAMGDSGGTIDVSLSRITVDDEFALKHTNLYPGEYVRISVKDTGCGMDKKTADRIFEPFFTTKDVGQGTGLGLSMAHGIITGCGGDITVTSRTGKGTTFDVFLPRINNNL